MASIREQIVVAAVAQLDGHPSKPPGTTVHRFRTRPIDRDKLPAWIVYPAGRRGAVAETVERLDHELDVERRLTLRVEIRVVGDPPDQALDPHYVAVVKALRSDQTLGGLARELQEVSTTFDAEEFEETVGAAGVDFEITYATDENDPEVAA